MSRPRIEFNTWFSEVQTANSYCNNPLGQDLSKSKEDFKQYYEGNYTALEAIVMHSRKLKPEAVVV